MSEADFRELKKGGMMRQREAGLFSVRLHVVGGRLDTAQLRAIQEAADRFGRGAVHLTTRQGAEIPHVPLESLASLQAFLAQAGVPVGTCGPRVRTVTACQGSVVCPSGVIDSQDLAQALDTAFYGRPVPHKFKLAVTGCTNNCIKAEENDVGVKGWIEPRWAAADCTYCGLCEASCATRAIRVEAGVAVRLDGAACIGCGDCIQVCPTGSMAEAARGFRIFVGGKFGRVPRLGRRILPVLRTKEEVVRAASAVLESFRRHGVPGERFAETVDRIGLAALEAEVQAAVTGEAGEIAT
jgi:dissimilatory sulfite reductase (desulfoviridin) alpha/beta subunit